MQGNGFLTEGMDDVSAQEVVTKAGRRMLVEKGVESSLPFGGKRLLTETNGERIEKFMQRLVAAGKGLPPGPSMQTAVSSPAFGR